MTILYVSSISVPKGLALHGTPATHGLAAGLCLAFPFMNAPIRPKPLKAKKGSERPKIILCLSFRSLDFSMFSEANVFKGLYFGLFLLLS